LDFGEFLLRSQPVLPCTLSTKTFFFFRVTSAEQLVPKSQEKSAMIRSVHGAPCMMCIVLKASVDNSIVWRYEAVLIATVEIDSVGVEKQSILNEEQVHVHGHQERNDKERRGPEQLVHRFIRDDGEG